MAADKRCCWVIRSNYFRLRKHIKTSGITGLLKKSKRPKNVRKSLIFGQYVQLVLQIRHQNPTYSKARIVVMIKRDHGGSYQRAQSAGSSRN
ncbi:hypothetical protein MIDIC_460031 [Alphaproteobacteria bacterium]